MADATARGERDMDASLAAAVVKARVRFRASVWRLAALSFGINLLVLATPLYMLQIYDRVLGSGSRETLLYLTLMAAAAIITMTALETLRSVVAQRIGARLDLTLAAPTFASAMDQSATGRDIQPLRDLASARNFIASPALTAMLDLPFAPFFLIVLTALQPVLGLATLIGVLVLAALAYVNQLAAHEKASDASKEQLRAVNAAQTFARHGEMLDALGMRANAMSRWGALHASSLNSLDGAGKIGAIFLGASKTLRTGLQMGILGLGAILVLNGYMTAGMIFAASLIAGRALQPIDQVIGNWRGIVHAKESWLRLQDVAADQGEARETLPLPPMQGNISVEQATYFHALADGTRAPEPILRRVSFEIEPGDTVAVIGPSGAGKTTLIRLMVGAIETSQGVVRYDGADVRQFASDVLGRQLGYLPQEPDLLPGTVADNIARLDADPDPEAVVQAARLANAHDMIQRLPDGYDTVLAGGGSPLSGGQKQRIALARAFYGNPAILLLDEPNANLDAAGEEALARAIASAKKCGISVLMVTQRMSALKHVDKVLHLRDGMVERFEARSELVTRVIDWKEGTADDEKGADDGLTAAQRLAAARLASFGLREDKGARAPDEADARQVDDKGPNSVRKAFA
ncbi:MAG: type I secretion system permease/ATPase [Pseudomonadota bacterium]